MSPQHQTWMFGNSMVSSDFCTWKSSFFSKIHVCGWKNPQVFKFTKRENLVPPPHQVDETSQSQGFFVIELDDGKIYGKPLYLMLKTMVSCRFSLKPIHWFWDFEPRKQRKSLWVKGSKAEMSNKHTWVLDTGGFGTTTITFIIYIYIILNNIYTIYIHI